ncbi:Gfo/Idh/MocA family oxidoreductase [Pirellulales bacterium]|nr:Gfo/Idh/MocA family oxidoreductase [Pirellulales bacterium]
MKDADRRNFLQTTVAAGLAAQVTSSATARASTDDHRLSLAVIGIRGRGGQLARDFAARSDCHISYLCDVDESLFASRVKEIAEIQESAPQIVTDFRRALDDRSLDAVVIATPDHWHALATVWACQAGKDVYVEKPISHSPWEGRQMVAAARRHDRIVQVGTQNRSAPYNILAKQYLESGKLGQVHFVRVCNQKYTANVKAVPDTAIPTGLDWNMWLGPAKDSPYNRNHHKAWNHFWQFSGGDIINDAVHQLDLARWLLGLTAPKTVYATGGRFAEQGVFESPDTQTALFEFEKLVMAFELTLNTPYMLKSDAELRNSDMIPHWPQNATRIEIFGAEGMMVVGRMGGGWQVFHRPKSRKPVVAAQEFGRFPDPEHQQNFVDSVRTRAVPNADIEEGHRSTLLCQLANISYRLGGRKLTWNEETETFVGDGEANTYLKREYRDPWRVPDEI